MKTLLFLIFLFFAVLAQKQPKSDFELFKLPDPVTVKQEIASIPAGWQPGIDTSIHRLTRITVFAGRPSAKASLIPDNDEQPGEDTCAIWTFGPKNADTIWIECAFSGTDITLSRAMPLTCREIRVYYSTKNRIDGYLEIRKVVFRK